MSSSISNSSIARSRSLRSNTLKPPSSIGTSQSNTGPSNVTLFLTNLRLLDLDLRDDWPGITALTFSTKDAQQNQKKRIQSVEWVLYQLFALWDPEETRNKLQPFYPPLEPLQSLNLRTALFRCLEQAKKTGVLGRDTILRKTMLDECKGDRLEEILAVFSNAVLKKIAEEQDSGHKPIAHQLASEKFSYTGERTVLSMLILAHKGSLRRHLLDKVDSRAQYHDFSDLLNLNERRIVRRHEQLKQTIEERRSCVDNVPEEDWSELRDHIQKNWTGSEEWRETLLYGDSRVGKDNLLGTAFGTVWKHVEGGNIGEIEVKKHVGLAEQLNTRIKDHEARLARWQEFGKTLSKTGSKSPAKLKEPEGQQSKKIDLGFSRHQSLQVGQSTEKTVTTLPSRQEYIRLVENMKSELADVEKPQTQSSRPTRRSMPPPAQSAASSPGLEKEAPAAQDEQWSSASDTDDHSLGSTASRPLFERPPPKSPPPARPMLEQADEITPEISTPKKKSNVSISTKSPTRGGAKIGQNVSMEEGPQPRAHPAQLAESESELADHILNSVTTSSPSPKKPRHTLSLAERTRLSMSRASHSKFSDLHEDVDNLAELTRLSIRTKSSQPTNKDSLDPDEKHADLIERTRKSMVGFEAAQKKAQIDRRKSVKEAKKKQRESSYFPKVEEEPLTPSVNPGELIDGDPDYESVFMSRPKIKTSPAISPTRVWEDGGGVD